MKGLVTVDIPIEDPLAEFRSLVDQLRGVIGAVETTLAGEQLFWTEEQLAGEFKCSVLTIQRKRREGKIKFKRLPGGQPVFTKAHIEEFLAS